MRAMRSVVLSLVALLATAAGAAAQAADGASVATAARDQCGWSSSWAACRCRLTPAERQPSLQFVAGGRVSGSDGCNRIRAPYTIAGARITFGPLIATRMACPGTESLARRFAAALKGTVRWRIAGRRLEFYGANDEPLVDFEARSGGATAGEEQPSSRRAGIAVRGGERPAQVQGVRLGVADGGAHPERRAPRRARRTDRDRGPAARPRHDARARARSAARRCATCRKKC